MAFPGSTGHDERDILNGMPARGKTQTHTIIYQFSGTSASPNVFELCEGIRVACEHPQEPGRRTLCPQARPGHQAKPEGASAVHQTQLSNEPFCSISQVVGCELIFNYCHPSSLSQSTSFTIASPSPPWIRSMVYWSWNSMGYGRQTKSNQVDFIVAPALHKYTVVRDKHHCRVMHRKL